MKHVLFIHGAGEGAHDEDAKLVDSLRRKLGSEYSIRFPRMPNEEDANYELWAQTIETEIVVMGDGAILVGHSIGASVLIKWVTSRKPPRALAGVFLIAAPFWHDHDVWHWPEVELSGGAASSLPPGLPIRFYHGRADEIVPFAHLAMYAKAIPQAAICALEGRDHQLNEDLSEVGNDIKEVALYSGSDAHEG